MQDKPTPAEPAFPSHGTMGEVAFQGMTLRDYFAAKAMQSLIARSTVNDAKTSADYYAEGAYALADAMLKARAP